jgi:hypothetical protein
MVHLYPMLGILHNICLISIRLTEGRVMEMHINDRGGRRNWGFMQAEPGHHVGVW